MAEVRQSESPVSDTGATIGSEPAGPVAAAVTAGAAAAVVGAAAAKAKATPGKKPVSSTATKAAASPAAKSATKDITKKADSTARYASLAILSQYRNGYLNFFFFFIYTADCLLKRIKQPR